MRIYNQLLDCLTEAESISVVKAYEDTIARLEMTKVEITDKIAQIDQTKPDFNKFSNRLRFLRKPL